MSVSRREREKLMREEAIISAAEKLFSRQGYEHTSMDEVAAAAEFTKRTVYQYFEGKQTLYYAVVLRGMQRLLAGIRAADEDAPNGLERFRRMRLAAWRCARTQADAFRVMSQIGVARGSAPNSVYEQQISALSSELFDVFRLVLEQGRLDDSIPGFADTQEQFAAFFIIIGTLARLGEVGGAYAELTGSDLDSFAALVLGLTDRLLFPSVK